MFFIDGRASLDVAFDAEALLRRALGRFFEHVKHAKEEHGKVEAQVKGRSPHRYDEGQPAGVTRVRRDGSA